MRGTPGPIVLAAAAAAATSVLCTSGLGAQGPLQARVPAEVPTVLARAFEHWPTRRAFVAEGCGTGLHFEGSLDGDEARALFDQGMMQLHGLAHFEAERSFRQVAALEPNCAMACWGAAMANVANPARAACFVEEAVRRRHHATPRERRFVDALAAFYEVSEVAAKPKAVPVEGVPVEAYALDVYEARQRPRVFVESLQVRSKRLLRAWEEILGATPEGIGEIEVRALVVRQIWLNAVAGVLAGAELDRQAARARQHLARILLRSPRHPAHFYRLQPDVIGDVQGALRSVAVAGHHAPAIPGQWAASGRVLARLHRHEDALEYFEAALRSAHACLQRERSMPFALPAYADDAAAHGRCLMRLGRVKAALEWLDYLSKLPRHPRLNRLEDPRSIAGQGRRCYLELCVQYRLEPKGNGPREVADPGPAIAALSRADALLAAGRPREAVEVLREEAAARPDRVATMARLVDAMARAGDRARAAAWLLRLRKVAGGADLDQALLAPATTLARELGLPEDWRLPRNRAVDWPRDIGPLPHLEALGPSRWTPPEPHGWVLRDAAGNRVSLGDYRGKPVVVVLHLGFG